MVGLIISTKDILSGGFISDWLFGIQIKILVSQILNLIILIKFMVKNSIVVWFKLVENIVFVLKLLAVQTDFVQTDFVRIDFRYFHKYIERGITRKRINVIDEISFKNSYENQVQE